MALTTQPSVTKLPHHEQLELCLTRAKYRQGRKLTAVRVYTVNDESKYLILDGVAAIKISREVEILCRRYGDIEFLKPLPDYPHEDYVEVYLVKYRVLKNARFAKKQLDGKVFYGQLLHVCYAPELETVEETREKLQDRRKIVAALTRYRQDASSTLDHVRKSKAIPPTAVRYMNQLRSDLEKANLMQLHHRADTPIQVMEELDKGGNQEDSTATLNPSKSSAGIPNEDEELLVSSSTATENIGLKNYGFHKDLVSNSEPTGEGQSVKALKGKRSSEAYMKPTKKIKVFGKNKLLSFQHD